MSRKIPAKEILYDLRDGMSKSRLREKYALTDDDLQKVIERIARERRTRAKALVRDVRAGLSDTAIMVKYLLSEEGLRHAFASLVDAGLIGLRELSNRSDLETDSVVVNFRKRVRRKPLKKVIVCLQSHPEQQYVLRDISEQGLSLIGMRAQVNQIVTITVLGDDEGEVMPFQVEAECRWATPPLSGNPGLAGFRIRRIADEHVGPLMALVTHYSRES